MTIEIYFVAVKPPISEVRSYFAESFRVNKCTRCLNLIAIGCI